MKYFSLLLVSAILFSCNMTAPKPVDEKSLLNADSLKYDSLYGEQNSNRFRRSDKLNFTDEHGKKHGWWLTEIKQGEKFLVVEEKFYVNDVLDGPYAARHDNGRLKEEGMYRKGKKTGDWNYYNETGKLLKTDTYADGLVIDTKDSIQ